MIKSLLLSACASILLACASFAWADSSATLRRSIEAAGPGITLGDLFEDAGAAASNVIAAAPAPGRTSTFSVQFIETAARAGGLHWQAPAGLKVVAVAGRGGGATQPISVTNAAVRRGELVSIVYATNTIQIATRLKALNDAAVGDIVQLQNPQSGRSVEAIVTGPSAARALRSN